MYSWYQSETDFLFDWFLFICFLYTKGIFYFEGFAYYYICLILIATLFSKSVIKI